MKVGEIVLYNDTSYQICKVDTEESEFWMVEVGTDGDTVIIASLDEFAQNSTNPVTHFAKAEKHKKMTEDQLTVLQMLCQGIEFALPPMWGHGASESCSHAWETYIGFTKRFEYCTKCDEQRDPGL